MKPISWLTFRSRCCTFPSPKLILPPLARAYTQPVPASRGTLGLRPAYPARREAVPEESARAWWTEVGGSTSRETEASLAVWSNDPDLRGPAAAPPGLEYPGLSVRVSAAGTRHCEISGAEMGQN